MDQPDFFPWPISADTQAYNQGMTIFNSNPPSDAWWNTDGNDADAYMHDCGGISTEYTLTEEEDRELFGPN
jgi:hypothetical protein